MTDRSNFPSDDDLSAIIDSTATAAALEQLENDPAARKRLEEIEEAIDLLQTTPVTPLDEATVDGLIERALQEAAGPGASVDRFREHPIRRAPTWAVAAVVIVIAAIGLALVWSGTRSDRGPRETAGPVGSETDLTDTENRTREESAGDFATDAESDAVGAGTALVDLGAHPDVATLRSHLADGFPSSPAGTDDDGSDTSETNGAPSPVEITRCGVQIAELYAGEGLDPTPEHTGLATIAGEPVLVYEFRSPDGDHRHLTSIVTPVDCDPQATFVRD